MDENPDTPRLRDELAACCVRHVTADTAAAVEAFSRPAIRLVHTGRATRSHLGGAVELGDETPWPHWRDRPLSLLAASRAA